MGTLHKGDDDDDDDDNDDDYDGDNDYDDNDNDNDDDDNNNNNNNNNNRLCFHALWDYFVYKLPVFRKFLDINLTFQIKNGF